MDSFLLFGSFWQLLVEYLLSRQQDEAAACVKELDCNLFHHEIVKRAVKVRRARRKKRQRDNSVGIPAMSTFPW